MWLDDWMCILATVRPPGPTALSCLAHGGLQVFAMVCAGNAIATTELGTGMHFWNIDAANETALWKVGCLLHYLVLIHTQRRYTHTSAICTPTITALNWAS